MMSRQWAPARPVDRASFSPAQCFEAGQRNHHISNTAYPIAHQTTWWPYRQPRKRHLSVVDSAFDGIDDLLLYAHIPFCEVRCSFCEYTVVGKAQLSGTDDYMRRLKAELALYRERLETPSRVLHGFDIGGGTPSFVESRAIAELVEEATGSFKLGEGFEISIETTPRIAAASPQKLHDYKACGIDRISMGIQVIQPDLLRILNRDGNGVEHHHRAVEHIRTAGFGKFNVDLMYGFANQSLDSWRATLLHALSLEPDYITLYRMRYKLTRISHQADKVHLDAVRAQSRLAKKILAASGYLANPGKNTYSRIQGDNGTSAYITRRVVEGMPYLGLGLGAQSFTHRTVSYNDGAAAKDLGPYLRSVDDGELPLQDLYDLPRCHMMAKMICVSLYFGEIHLGAFQSKFGVTLEEAFPREVRYVLDRGLMEWTSDGEQGTQQVRALSMTQHGADHFAGVVALFHAPSVKRYLLERDPRTCGDLHRNRKMALKVAERGA